MFQLDKKIANLQQYMAGQGWLQQNEAIAHTEVPGEGNMNFTLRIVTNQRSVIIKQSRDYVEKYPQVAAPVERVTIEADFYKIIGHQKEIQAQMPIIIALDRPNSIMLMEDLGAGSDFTYLYKKGENIPKEELTQLVDFVASLHNSHSIASIDQPIYNRNMRKLNHEHIFQYPYLADNGINLDDIIPGLQEAAIPFKENQALKSALKEIGDLYLSDGQKLLHGDYFPGSWLRTASGIKVIDPEFCFFGVPEFEVGVMVAHLEMAQQSPALINQAIQHYQSKAPLDLSLQQKFTAVEVLRRIMGLAQLPLALDLEERIALLRSAAKALTN
ncbi:MAG: 5-methylthioribose kinase [Marivirga sp.]|jgi:5-methylthioribose kinase